MSDSNLKAIPYNTLRLVSFFLALLLWVIFSGRIQQEEPEGTRVNRTMPVPIGYTGQPSTMEINPSQLSVFVSLSGNEAEMKMVNGDMLMVKLDLSQLEPGSHQVPILNENVEIPLEFKSINIETISPRYVNFDVERKIRKALKVIVRSKGTAAENYELESLDVTPEEVTIYGPESKVKDLTFLIGEPVDISGLTADTQGRVVFNYDKHFPKDTTMEEGINLEYHAIIREIIKKKSIGSMKPEFEGWDPKLKIRPKTVNVSVQGPVTVLDKLDKSWLKITVQEFIGDHVPDHLPLSYKWEPPVSEGTDQAEPEGDTLDWSVLARLDEIEVILEPNQVEVKK